MQDAIGIEKVIHGQPWGAVHNGYFSDPAVARALVKAILDVQAMAPADVIVDLGGGTGFLLSQLVAQGLGTNAAMINVDCSEAQLEGSEKDGIAAVHLPITDFTRSRVARDDQRLCLAMRSVLHYFGVDGLDPLLAHLRAQVKSGEHFVHQSAAFDDEQDAACLNSLYRHMRTRKWYPTVREMEQRLAKAGWRVAGTRPAPTLVLDSGDLAHRYALDAGDVARIGDTMLDEFGGGSPVFRRTDAGFSADLHYRIFICVAA
jgi:hypothetical protein